MRNERIIDIDSLNPISDAFAQNLLKELTRRKATVAIAEGCTGGRLINKITIPGATKVFRIGTIAYSRKAKLRLGVDEDLMEKYGEYSPEVAVEMAREVRRLRNDSIGIATVGEIKGQNTSSLVRCAIALENGDVNCISFTVNSGTRSEVKSVVSNESLITSLHFTQGHLEKINGNAQSTALIFEDKDDFLKQSITLSRLLNRGKLSISTIESCTGGALGDAMTDIPGSSRYFDSSWVVYDENSKVLLGVPLSTMAFGQVYSPQVSEEMAKALQRKTKTDIVISTTGTMDNWDTRPYHLDSPPGTVYYSIGIYGKLYTNKIHLIPQNRKIMKKQLVNIIFDDLIFLINFNGVGIKPSYHYKQGMKS